MRHSLPKIEIPTVMSGWGREAKEVIAVPRSSLSLCSCVSVLCATYTNWEFALHCKQMCYHVSMKGLVHCWKLFFYTFVVTTVTRTDWSN